MQQTQKPKRRRTRIVTLVLAVLVVAGGCANYLRPLPAVALTRSDFSVKADAAQLDWPAQGQAAVGATGYGVLATNGVQTGTPTASTTKVILALAVLKQKPLAAGQQGPMLTITQADVDSYNKYVAEDGSIAAVTVGEQISEYQALQALLLPSANNFADTLAAWAFGSLDNYLTYANTMAQQMGMSGTALSTDASGFSPNTVSTAHDLVVAGEAALQNPVIAQIVAQSSATVPVAGTVRNVNTLLGTDGINGIKTGNTDQAGGCFIFSATRAVAGGTSTTIVGAVMNAPDLSTALSDALPLLNSAAANFETITPVHTNQTLGTYKAAWDSSGVNAVAAKDASFTVWKGTSLSANLTLNNATGAMSAGSNVGHVDVVSGTHKASIPVTLKTAIPAPSFWWRLTRH